MTSPVHVFSALFLACVFGLAACGSDEKGDGNGSGGGGNEPNRPDQTGAACALPRDCYPDVADGALQGEAECLTQARDGYCTHTCESDDDCCAAEGECKTVLAEVCSPFESTGGMHCFLSCEREDVAAATDVADEQEYCQKKASPDFICRSSGGGTANRKICVPGDCGVGADCTTNADCAGLECVTTFSGGYCTMRACTTNADCPGGALCVTSGGENYCYRACAQASDCSFCRSGDASATCSGDVTFAETGTTGSVCVPG